MFKNTRWHNRHIEIQELWNHSNFLPYLALVITVQLSMLEKVEHPKKVIARVQDSYKFLIGAWLDAVGETAISVWKLPQTVARETGPER